jgi:hypothetical protein
VFVSLQIPPEFTVASAKDVAEMSVVMLRYSVGAVILTLLVALI